MAAIPESTRSSVALRLLDHAGQHWPQLHRVQVTSRAGFAYVTGILPDGEQIPLCRLRYGGSAHSFGFAIYSAARARYEDAVLLTGSPVGTPQEALDTACTVHLAGLGHEPPTNLRAHPLKVCPGATVMHGAHISRYLAQKPSQLKPGFYHRVGVRSAAELWPAGLRAAAG
jgi:hypothetical protein